MTAVIIPFPETHFVEHSELDDAGLGVCPTCRHTNGILNDYKDHWGVCDAHRVKWEVGYNLFSAWQFETQLDWSRNRALLAGYREVEPSHDPHWDCDDEAHDDLAAQAQEAVDLVAAARHIFADDLA